MTASAGDRAWDWVGRLVLARPRLVTACALTLALAAGAAALAWLQVRPGYVALLSPDVPSNARYLELLEELGNVEALHVLVESADPGQAGAFVDRLGPAIADLRSPGGAPLVDDVQARFDVDWLLRRLPAHVPVERLDAVRDDPVVRRALTSPGAAELLRAAEDLLSRTMTQGAAGSLGGAEAVAACARLEGLLNVLAGAALGEDVSLRGWLAGVVTDGSDVDAAGHLRIGPGRLLLTVTPADVENDHETMTLLLDGVREAEARVRRELGEPQVTVRLTGAPVLVVNEMQAATRDVTRSTLLALVLVAGLFALSFDAKRHVGAAIATLLAGLAITFGAALVFVGYLNLFSVVFAAVLVGLGIDFAIHVVNHHEAALRLGTPVRESLRAVFRVTGPATLTGAATTAAAFFTTAASRFRGFSQLGVITGIGVLACVLLAYTLLPALLAEVSRPAAPRRRAAHPWTRRLLALPMRRPRTVAVLAVGTLVAAAASLPGLRFDYDLLNLQPGGTDAVELARQEGGIATHVAFSLVEDLDAARALEERYHALPSVAAVRSAASLLPPLDDAQRQALGRLSAWLDSSEPPPVPADEAAEAAAAAGALTRAVEEAQDAAFDGGLTDVVRALDGVLEAADAAVRGFGDAAAAGRLGAFRAASTALVRELRDELPVLARGDGLRPEDLPPSVRARLVGRSGRLAVIVEPAESIWDRDALTAFVAELRSVDPNVTGPPVQVLEITELMRRSYERAAVTAFLAIVAIVVLVFRDALATVVSIVPLAAGFLVMLGGLAWLDVPLNPANLVALPLILGIGVDNGIHLAHRWRRLGDASVALFEVGHAIVVTSLTTIAGFSGLLLASHRGVRSLGQVACLGICAMLVTSVVFLPAVLSLRRRGSTREADS